MVYTYIHQSNDLNIPYVNNHPQLPLYPISGRGKQTNRNKQNYITTVNTVTMQTHYHGDINIHHHGDTLYYMLPCKQVHHHSDIYMV